MIIGIELGIYREILVQLFQLRWGSWEETTKSLQWKYYFLPIKELYIDLNYVDVSSLKLIRKLLEGRNVSCKRCSIIYNIIDVMEMEDNPFVSNIFQFSYPL